MKILVAVKRAADYAAKIRVNREGTAVELAGVKMSINPFCEIALEEGIRMMERRKGMGDKEEKEGRGEVIVVTCGSEKHQDVLRHSLALGADRGILVNTEDSSNESSLQPLAVSKLLHRVVEREKADIVLMGKQAIDSDFSHTGQMLAGLLGWPQATFTSKIEFITGKKIEATREVETGSQTIGVPLPAVVTCDLRLNTPRYVSLPQLMKSKSKPLEIIKASSFAIDLSPRLKVVSVIEPQRERKLKMVNSVDELIQTLKSEGKLFR